MSFYYILLILLFIAGIAITISNAVYFARLNKSVKGTIPIRSSIFNNAYASSLAMEIFNCIFAAILGVATLALIIKVAHKK